MKEGFRVFAKRVRNLIAFLGVAALAGGWVSPARAVGVLETPDGRTRASGLGLVSGWHCHAERIEVRIDGGELQVAGSGTPRRDTVSVCGHEHTGFGMLFNFSMLDPEIPHEVVAYADGVEFARTSFRASNLGDRYLVGRSGEYRIRNFPDVGDELELAWNESKQGFVVERFEPGDTAVALSGVYHGAIARHACGDVVQNATFTLTVGEETIDFVVDMDGLRCEMEAVPYRVESGRGIFAYLGGGETRVVGDEAHSRFDCFEIFRTVLSANGERLYGTLKDLCGAYFAATTLSPLTN